ncbi:hypothetical protein PSE_p0296 (plasmid) [Pseudovibrio sp. FO-BEG1]|nr:hypothetical protein PSE_p0296 [Pseudovibrio sp. FO-BEG1]
MVFPSGSAETNTDLNSPNSSERICFAKLKAIDKYGLNDFN